MKKRFKLYKSGKNWCVMAIAVLAVTMGVATTAYANDNSVNTTENLNAELAADHSSSENSNSSSVACQSSAESNATSSSFAAGATPVSNSTTTDGDQGVLDEKNGWVQDTKTNQWTYYDHGQVTSGRTYSYLPTIGKDDGSHNWYLVDNGVAQSGVQEWADTYYDFDPTTYLRVDNNYVQSQWGDWYMFGQDGRIATKVYQWAGTYYYFDPTTYLRVDNDYRQSQWGDWYMFGQDGRIATKVYQWAGTYYYFDPVTYLRVNNDYRQSQWGLWYLFGGIGTIQTGVHRWMGSVYYFDPSTYLKVTNAWRDGLYFGSDGRLTNGNFATQVINWFLQRENKLTYSMYGSRTGRDGTADCSGSMTMALRSAGASQPQTIYSTETLHGYLLRNGYHLAYEGQSQPATLQYEDVIIWGHRAASLGGAGHTMVATGTGDYPTVISTCYLTEGQRGTAVQEVNYDWYWNLAEKPYQYVYRLNNAARN